MSITKRELLARAIVMLMVALWCLL